MELKQNLELRRLLVPELRQSLKILTLPLLDLKNLIQEELVNNPLIEELVHEDRPPFPETSPPFFSQTSNNHNNQDFRSNLAAKEGSLYDVLLRQLGIFTKSDEELKIGQEIIENIDENGYLRTQIEEVAHKLNISTEKVKNVLKIIQKFDPPGVAARTLSECLLIQLELANEKDPLIERIIKFHLEDIARKNYNRIVKALKEPRKKIEPLIKKILRLDPKPGRNYSSEEVHTVIPDILINGKGKELEIIINNEEIPTLKISKTYQDMLKKQNIDPVTKEFIRKRLSNAVELLRAMHRRKQTLRKVAEAIIEVQQQAIQNDLSYLRPLTFKEIAQKLNIHETTVCRAVMNKYVQTPWGVLALKDFFPSRISNGNGQDISSPHIKLLIKELIEQEDKKHPLSDQNISKAILEQRNLNVSRRTIAKYREELRIPSTTYRRER